MTYEKALKEARRVGASKSEGDPLLAQTIWALSHAHAINPEMVYNGALAKGMTASEVRKLDCVALGDLQFLA